MFKFTISSDKIIYISKVIGALAIIFGAIGYTFGFEVPTIATSEHVNENKILISQNYIQDYDRDISVLKKERRGIRQQKYELEERGRPIDPGLIEDEQEIEDEIEALKDKKKEFENQVKSLTNV